MADEVRQWTDKKLSKMEHKISKIYKNSAKGISKKWNAFMEEAEKKAIDLQTAYDDAKKTGDKALIKEAGMKLSQYKKEITLQNTQYKEMLEETTFQLAHVNETALAYINDQMPSIYMNNFNGIKGDADNLGIQFGIVDEATVKRLITDGDLSLLRKRLDIPKDERWNTKQLNSSVLQGILQGESMQDIAKRINPIVGRNEASAIRNARTMVTCAENRGRLDSYKQMEEEGAVMKKVWLATPDGRTRDWHLEMDGQEVDTNESFIDGLGNELEYPGDPGGAPESVYNCRCTMHAHVVGIKRADGSIKKIDYESQMTTLHETQIEEEKQRRVEAEKEGVPTFTPVNGSDISQTWERRPNEFAFEIEDVINAQGFDGLPRVVSSEEFDRFVQQANDGNGFIAQRTYSAPDQETLDAYRQQLYEGKWYVDCSTGGAQYGQGMYCAADYNGKLTDGIKEEMQHYIDVGKDRNSVNFISMTEEQQRNALPSIVDELFPNYSVQDRKDLVKFLTYDRYDENRTIVSLEEAKSARERLLKNNVSIGKSAHEIEEYKYMPKSYIETMTLDPSAKIITYKDLEQKINDIGKATINGIPVEKWKANELIKNQEAFKAGKITAEEGMRLDEEISKKALKAEEEAFKLRAEYQSMDRGSIAALWGYDAINAVGHGASSSYTVILNRTKVIILGE